MSFDNEVIDQDQDDKTGEMFPVAKQDSSTAMTIAYDYDPTSQEHKDSISRALKTPTPINKDLDNILDDLFTKIKGRTSISYTDDDGKKMVRVSAKGETSEYTITLSCDIEQDNQFDPLFGNDTKELLCGVWRLAIEQAHLHGDKALRAIAKKGEALQLIGHDTEARQAGGKKFPDLDRRFKTLLSLRGHVKNKKKKLKPYELRERMFWFMTNLEFYGEGKGGTIVCEVNGGKRGNPVVSEIITKGKVKENLPYVRRAPATTKAPGVKRGRNYERFKIKLLGCRASGRYSVTLATLFAWVGLDKKRLKHSGLSKARELLIKKQVVKNSAGKMVLEFGLLTQAEKDGTVKKYKMGEGFKAKNFTDFLATEIKFDY